MQMAFHLCWLFCCFESPLCYIANRSCAATACLPKAESRVPIFKDPKWKLCRDTISFMATLSHSNYDQTYPLI